MSLIPPRPNGKRHTCSSSSKSSGIISAPFSKDSDPSGSVALSKNLFQGVYGPLAVYLHFPFCRNRCRYCDFYKEKYDRPGVERFFRAVEYETELVLSLFGHEPIEIASIYIGGGTPSLIRPELLERWLEALKSYGRLLPGYEFTVEANPETLTADFAREALALGINRVVIGVQSFRIESLRRLGRRQQTKDIYRAFYYARLAGFENIGGDLIFGLPDQKTRHVKSDIERLIDLEPKHISFYQLTVEEKTPLFEDVKSGRIIIPGEDQAAQMYRIGAHTLVDRGYRRYEVSNFARDGWRSRHNYAYWQGAPYIGLGPAAHGQVKDFRYANRPDLADYFEAVEKGLLPLGMIEELSEEQRLMESVMLSLRTADGLDKQQFIIRFGAKALPILEGATAGRLMEAGYLVDDSGFIRLTDDGFLVADKIIADLVGQSPST